MSRLSCAVVSTCLSFALASLVAAQGVLSPVSGLAFSPYVSGQDPNQNVQLSPDQIRQRLTIIAPFTKWVRTYGCLNGLGQAAPIAHSMNLKVALGIWIGKDLTANTQEIACAVALANAGTVDMLVVGSEVLLRGDVSEAQLLAYLQSARAQVKSNIPITTAEVYGLLLKHPALIQASDIVLAHFFPWWEGVSLPTAVSSLNLAYQQLVAAAGSKQVGVGETGWPSCGAANGAAVPNAANAAAYFLNFVSWAKATKIPVYFYFQALDEDWKAQYEGPQGKCWGVWTNTGALKPGMQAVFDGQTVPDNWSGSSLPGGPGTPSVTLTFVGPKGDGRPAYGNVYHFKPADYAIGTVIHVGSLGWWSKPYADQLVVPIQADGSFFVPINTGGSDILSDTVRACVLPKGTQPPLVLGASTLPATFGQNAIACTEVTRGTDAICGRVTDATSGAGLAGVTLTLAGVTAIATTISTGDYCFPNLTHAASYTLTPALSLYAFSPPTQAVASLNGVATVNFTSKSVPGQPGNPLPPNGATGIATSKVLLSWTTTGLVTSNDVCVGISVSPPCIGNTTGNTYDPGTLSPGTTYHWQIISKSPNGNTGSPIWSFTTAIPLTIQPLSPITATIGSAISPVSLAATGGSDAGYAWSATGLPSGLTLSTAGALSGAPGIGTQGTYAPQITVVDSLNNHASTILAITVKPSTLRFSCTPLTGPTTTSASYSATCTASGGIPPFQWAISTGTLPTGLTLKANGASAVISGTPTTPGPYTYTLKLSDSGSPAQTTTQSFTGTIAGQGLSMAGSIRVGTNPQWAAMTPDGTEIYVSNYDSGTISVINTTTNTAGTNISVGGHPLGIAVAPDGTRIYIANTNGSVTVVNRTTKTVLATVPTGYPVRDLGITKDGKELYLALEYGGLGRVQITSTKLTLSIMSKTQCPEGISLTPDGTHLYVIYQCFGGTGSSGRDAIGVFSTSTDTLLTSITGLTNVGQSGARVSPKGQLWVGGSDVCTAVYYSHAGCPASPGVPENIINVIQTATSTRLQTLGFAPSEGIGTTISFWPDGSRALVGGNNLKIIDTATFARIATLPIPASGSVVFTPNGTRAYAVVPSQNAVVILQ